MACSRIHDNLAYGTIIVMNQALIITELTIVGLVLGSFINALVWRLHNKRDWIRERSECPHCHHVLAAKDLIPVLSYLLLKGKCRYCGHSIEDNPLSELATPALYVLSYLCWPQTLSGAGLFNFVCWLVLLIGFMALIVYDVRWFLLPDKIVLPVTIFAVLKSLILPIFYHQTWGQFGLALASAFFLYGLFYVLFMLSDGTWIGGGDVKLVFVLGLLAGDPLRASLVLFFASASGLLMAIPQMIGQKRQSLKLKIPFGPFLVTGLVIVVLFGTHITDWYWRLLT